MKVAKSQLADALKALGKVSDRIRIAGRDSVAVLEACDGKKQVTISLEAEGTEPFLAVVALTAIKQAIGGGRRGTVELRIEGDEVGVYTTVHGHERRIGMRNSTEPWPELENVPEDAVCVGLPDDFAAALIEASAVIDRHEPRKHLRGVNLSCHGLTATDGKQLLHIPMPNALAQDLTLPFPVALLAAKPTGETKINVWTQAGTTMFCMEVGSFEWYAPAVEGNFPAWKHIIPRQESLDGSITFNDPKAVIEFLNTVPNSGRVNAIELNGSAGVVTILANAFPELRLETPASITGTPSLAMNKPILLRMLKLGYSTIKTGSRDYAPVLAEGGMGVFVAMPVKVMKKLDAPAAPASREVAKETVEVPENVDETNKPVNKEIYKMDEAKKIESEPLDELNAGIEELRQNLKTLFDSSAQLSRKLKEAALAQKQKEREYVQARRAIERIRAAV